MKYTKSLICFLFLSSFKILILLGQATIPATGGNASGGGGSVSYTIGQISNSTLSGSNGSLNQGVQQTYEISVVTTIINTEEINLEYAVYPNPASMNIKLVIRTKDFNDLQFKLYDLHGVLLQKNKVENEETDILMNSYLPAVYFLKVLSGSKEIKTFKIIKN